MNRLHNCSNPYQGKAKKVLCVCSAGLLRSPTTAKVLGEKYGFNTRAVGLDTGHALIPIDEVLLSWADEVVCMDNRQQDRIFDLFETHKIASTPVTVLNIPDNFAYMDDVLVTLIETNYEDSLTNE